MIKLSQFAVALLTGMLLALTRTAEELAVKVNRYNFFSRCESVRMALRKPTYADAAQELHNSRWFSEVAVEKLAQLLQSCVEKLPSQVTEGLGLPETALYEITAPAPVEPVFSAEDEDEEDDDLEDENEDEDEDEDEDVIEDDEEDEDEDLDEEEEDEEEVAEAEIPM